jgi:uncharacterized protein YcgI (DUF1989 family)
MNVVHEHVMPPKSGHSVLVKRHQHLRITDLEGKQVVDMALFNADNYGEKLSTSNSRTRYVPRPGAEYVPRDKLMEGDTLMSTLCRPMMTIVEEAPEPKGVHDVHNRMCNSFLFESHGVGPRDGCHEIISQGVARYGIRPEDIPDTMDVFMNFQHDCQAGRWRIEEPVSKPGDTSSSGLRWTAWSGSRTARRRAHQLQRRALHSHEDRGPRVGRATDAVAAALDRGAPLRLAGAPLAVKDGLSE